MVEMTHASVGTLVCCGQEMQLMEEQNKDYKIEKHVPILEENEEGVIVTVGSTLHPMEEKHFIEWIEVISQSGKVCRQHLKPHDEPKAHFCIKKAEVASIREYCNVHDLWKA